jgi:quinohemoprotein amine dehydrogenase alpha subunit
MKKTIAVGAALFGVAVAAGGARGFSQDSLVWKKCTDCHEPAAGKIPRVEEIRTTPEEWTVIIDRMARLHGMDLDAGEMDGLLKELCSTQILSPQDAAKVSYLDLFDNPQHVETPSGPEDQRFFATCVRCHSAGKILSYRMTKGNWAKLRDFHLYVDPALIFQMREMHWIEEADAVLEDLANAYPYGGAWQAPEASLAGSWMILGTEPGKGTYRGEAQVDERGAGDFTLVGKLEFSDGTTEAFRGEANLYGGYALRTRTRHNGFETVGAYTFLDGVLRGRHHFPAPDFRMSSSTWVRSDENPRVLRITPGYMLAGEATALTIEGQNLPELGASDLSFAGGDVEVLWARRVSGEVIEARVVSQSPEISDFTVGVKGLDAGSVRSVPRIDYITVAPAMGRARVSGGAHYPPEGVQFEATAYSNGANVWDPSDDVRLGPVPATFRLEEETTRPGDDDLRWLGGIEPDGTYIPIGNYGPITAREYSGEGTGLVKVVAEYQRGGRSHRGEAKLTVTVPDYIQRIR